jgi:hypothetical protein
MTFNAAPAGRDAGPPPQQLRRVPALLSSFQLLLHGATSAGRWRHTHIHTIIYAYHYRYGVIHCPSP